MKFRYYKRFKYLISNLKFYLKYNRISVFFFFFKLLYIPLRFTFQLLRRNVNFL